MILKLFVLALLFSPTFLLANTACPVVFNNSGHVMIGRSLGETNASLKEKRLLKVKAINEEFYASLQGENIRAKLIPEFETMSIFADSGRIPKDAKLRIIGLHGNGAQYSQNDVMSKLIRYFGESGKEANDYKSGSVSRKLRNHPQFIQAAVEAFDIIGHGTGPLAAKYSSLESSLDYIIPLLQKLKAETPHLPFVLYTRSASGILAAEIIRKAPGLVDGLIAMSPPVPRKQWVEYDIQKVLHLEKQGALVVNKEGLAWAEMIMLSANWNPESVFRKVPTLILTGGKDPEMENYERHYYSLLAQSRENISYKDIEVAGHDIMKQDTKQGYKNSMYVQNLKMISDFLYEISN